MTPIEKQIVELLDRKTELTNFTPTYRWLIEAVVLLLRSELDLREQLRNAGLLR
jgi:hypothetical protein